MKTLKILALSLFTLNAFADGNTLGTSTTVTNPHIAGVTNSGFYTDGTNLLSAIAGTNIWTTNASGLSINGKSLIVTTGGTSQCSTTDGVGLSYTTGATGNAYVCTGTNDNLNFQSGSVTTASIDTYGRIQATLPVGVPTSSSCGTTPTLAGNDQNFLLNAGSGTVTSCVVTFAHAWAIAPRAYVLSAANAAAAAATTLAYVASGGITTTTLTITGSVLASTSFFVHCE